MITEFLIKTRRHPELFILLLVIVIIAMLVIPLPTYLVDFLIGLNIVISALVFLSSFYIDRILSFSTFPAVLLITTLFRLALSISTSRLILNDADAGDIIATFGQFVIGDNLIVGFVIFSIVTIVQFMVITKGAERVAEVAARFSLDGMPGKQMGIDADLRAGSIDSDAAKERRSVVERESQLYGSFDGAMKFIKGDAIAGIIVIFINFIGGISVGISQHGMDMSTALTTYTMLTIGDGLVAQIPSLLIAISAGFIVTRVNGDGDNMGQTMMDQLLGNPFVLLIAAMLALGIGSLPGFPFFIFAILAAGLSGLFYFKWSEKKRQVAKKNAPAEIASGEKNVDAEGTSLGLIGDLDSVAAETVPLILLVPTEQLAALQKASVVERYRSQFFIDYGIHLPEMMLKASDNLSANTAAILINEIKADEFSIYFGLLRIVNSTDELKQLGVECVTHNKESWTDSTNQASLTQLGYQLRSAIDELYYCLSVSLVRHVNEYFGVQETKDLLDKLDNKYPDLMKEVLRHATVQRIAEVFQRLLSEKISIRNMKMIMESLALWAPREKDVIALVEHVRTSLSRYICHKFSQGETLRVINLSAEFEEKLRQGIRNTSGGSFLNLEPAVAEELIDALTLATDKLTISNKDMVILSSVDIRRFVKRFIDSQFKDLEVMSFGEITDSVSIDVLRTV
ncbi:EscV/YscV/HrcV family type III secretion system export apparatus protein [Yersinia nurmii]|uniref:EscV/YscV/HrcV family type III secretion system export apparatus protein n=1 Tax=Yersinia nurmii TaxID=685706 RepID=A0AAW7K4G5_9GAMM|nr:EscV/YscV/HrcV family type III secretion system export apparatus protein [Yersinia nurmii]MDN0086139.1 EscV/YscV/HrcV family type III secretion system export apparatus protein [Yersinia nurmii]CND83727.1 type III secretion system apparatus protein [Yersinia nurmii]